ncbi:UDP-2,4-diacetamido-2,4,6-trideoxy-beta-L-altropyranose hydrolase [Herbaspirillum lusitanum]|uniref:UDP-2,4-diacetamido-2,4, 6-trideoxy-beta-L-altropyranose hydrolase n=1 Tax=Herbaspirillum lusitanum TaxID=213312 RepID=UPI0022385795|nr:UDP-2,4-diacetamido-2,4,6-trideoxy-beta-L-altropyranose hydrolase [Herbaspirillum lusitanum]MCW5300591.1 UDP-2,4-diacetamido-2,4,6-trideoxy-beta-L-altropyranose hydrolase [Herbaspirillum lusitanum]
MDCSINIFFRANAYAAIGTGHVMRCLSLANAFAGTAATTYFVGHIDDVVLRDWIVRKGHRLVLLDESGDSDNAAVWPYWAKPQQDDWVVLDGYAFDMDDHLAIRRTGARLMVIDDLPALAHYCVDMILNQNFYAEGLNYPCDGSTHLLLGPRFSLLRESFVRTDVASVPACATRLLVSLGGSDPAGVGLTIIAALERVVDIGFEVRYIAGSSNPHLDRINTAADQARCAGHRIDVLPYTDDMPGVMRWAQMALIAAGSTTLEAAYMGLPCLVVVLAENQCAVAESMEAADAARSLGWGDRLDVVCVAEELKKLALDAPAREKMQARGRALVDGAGARRVVEEMLRERS